MPVKPNMRNWNDVQTAIATVAIVTTLGLWNLFATPAKAEAAQAEEPVIPPTEPSATESPAAAMPQVKIMFTQVATQVAPQTTVVQQTQEKKKKNNNNNDTKKKKKSVTQTKSS